MRRCAPLICDLRIRDLVPPVHDVSGQRAAHRCAHPLGEEGQARHLRDRALLELGQGSAVPRHLIDRHESVRIVEQAGGQLLVVLTTIRPTPIKVGHLGQDAGRGPFEAPGQFRYRCGRRTSGRSTERAMVDEEACHEAKDHLHRQKSLLPFSRARHRSRLDPVPLLPSRRQRDGQSIFQGPRHRLSYSTRLRSAASWPACFQLCGSSRV